MEEISLKFKKYVLYVFADSLSSKRKPWKYSDIIIGEGILKGFISRECRGTNGFGFDEIFELPNGLTLAELTPEEKNEISARSLAVKDLKKKLTIQK